MEDPMQTEPGSTYRGCGIPLLGVHLVDKGRLHLLVGRHGVEQHHVAVQRRASGQRLGGRHCSVRSQFFPTRKGGVHKSNDTRRCSQNRPDDEGKPAHGVAYWRPARGRRSAAPTRRTGRRPRRGRRRGSRARRSQPAAGPAPRGRRARRASPTPPAAVARVAPPCLPAAPLPGLGGQRDGRPGSQRRYCTSGYRAACRARRSSRPGQSAPSAW